MDGDASRANGKLYLWLPGGSAVSVTFNGNKPRDAGTVVNGKLQNQFFKYNETQALSANTFNLPGYSFLGWNTQPDGKGIPYSNGQSVKNLTGEANAIVTLYAQWQAKTYQISFDPGGGMGTMSPQSFTFDTPAKLSKNLFIKSNCSIIGWNSASLGSLYGDEFVICNLCVIDSYGNLSGLFLKALWADFGEAVITVTENGLPKVLNPATIKLCLNGTEFTPFTIDSFGIYRCSGMAAGEYELAINGYNTDGVKVIIAAGNTTIVNLFYCTVTINADTHASAYIVDGNAKLSQKLFA